MQRFCLLCSLVFAIYAATVGRLRHWPAWYIFGHVLLLSIGCYLWAKFLAGVNTKY